MNTDRVLASLSMDLVRVAMGYQRGSSRMADRFKVEAQARLAEIDHDELETYMQKVIADLTRLMDHGDQQVVAERSLMYSTLIKNYLSAYSAPE